jgi:alpha-tubulin suppressor-like RCC1 family protein
MTRASRIVLIVSMLTLPLVAVTTTSAGAAAAPVPTQVAAPQSQAGCSRINNGTVRCAGLNNFGQLGNGTTTLSVVPVVVHNTGNAGQLTGVTSVSTGNFFACALISNGTVDCWGDNSSGQLGNGTTTPSSFPVNVKSPTGAGVLNGVVQISTGKYTTCARLKTGGVDCWGHNGYYALGDGTNHDHLVPHAVLNGAGHAPLTGQINISVSQYDACSVQNDGTARCWGLNQFGILGTMAGPFSPLPTRVRAVTGSGFLTGVASIAAAPNNTCALLKNGTADCWGQNTSGQLGDGSVTTRTRPVVVKNVLGTADPAATTPVSASSPRPRCAGVTTPSARSVTAPRSSATARWS